MQARAGLRANTCPTFSLAYTYASHLSGESAAEADELAFVARIAVDTIEVAWDFGSFLAYGFGALWTAILLLRVAGVPNR